MAPPVAARAPVPGERTVSILKACEATGVGRRTMHTWLATGKVEYIRTAGGAVRIYWLSLWRDRDGAEFSEGSTSRDAS
jgi:hypothetical protein